MDPHFNIGTVYHTENIQAFAGLPNLQARYSQNPQSGSHTLPPLVPQRNAFTFNNEQLNHPSRPLHPAYPTNSSLFSNAVSFQGQNQQVTYSTNAYTQGLSQPPQNASFPFRPANPYSFDQNHTQTMSGRLGELRPMPAANGVNQTPQSSSTAYTSSRPLTSSINSSENDSTERTHVVGSQGRRGILPSAAGRPAAITNDGPATTKTTVVPVKDSDGKFPCPHCNRTYLHAKHLKRHLLRHTGDRPYICFLCNDSFSRSDILKRHFAKCSIRRGNPTGATHLSNSSSNLKKQQGKNKTASVEFEQRDSLDSALPTGSSSSTDAHFLGLGIDGFPGDYQTVSTPVSRNTSLKRHSSGAHVRDKRSMTGPVAPAFNRGSFVYSSQQTGAISLPVSAVSTPFHPKQERHSDFFPVMSQHHMTSDTEGMPQNFSPPSFHPTRNSLPHLTSNGHVNGNNFDWASIHPSVAEDYSNAMFTSTANDDTPIVKTEAPSSRMSSATVPDQNDYNFGNLFSNDIEIPA